MRKNILALLQNNHQKWYVQDREKYINLYRGYFGAEPEIVEFPQINDKTDNTEFDPHYTYQGPWVMRHLLNEKPEKHIDIGSWTAYLGFFSSLQPTEFVDIRPANLQLPGLSVKTGSILDLPYGNKKVKSVSCLHVVEHIGLGRYGDDLDPAGTLKALDELQRVLAYGGHLYLSLPVGREITYFNAHRVTHPNTVIKVLNELTLVSMSAVMDDGSYLEDPKKTVLARQKYACGLFHFTREKV